MTTTNTGDSPAILFSTLSDDQPRELPLALEGFPTEIEVKVGEQTKKFPVAYFEKDVIETGDYQHPQTKQRFSVDEKRIDTWVSKFNDMKTAGAEVHCPVDHSDKAEDNKGFVVKMRRDGNKLKSTLQVIGDDGALLALRNRCSVQFWNNYTDEKGRQWGDAIEHVAFTPIPVISGQGPFVPIAASRGQQSTPVFYLSASLHRSPDMDLTKLREATGAAKEIPDEKLIELAVTKLTENGEAVKLAKTKTDELQTKLTAAEEQATSLSRKLNPVQPDPEAIKDRHDLGLRALEMSVKEGDMPMAIMNDVKAKMQTGGKPNVYMLSRHEAFDARPVDWVIDLFKGKQLGVKIGEVTKIQLDRRVPDEQADAAKTMDDARKEGDAHQKRQLQQRGLATA